MKPYSKVRSLQWFLPALLAISGLLIVSINGIFQFVDGQRKLERQIVTDIRSQITRLQANLTDSLNRGDKDAAQREIAYQGINPSINKLMLLNVHGKILLSMDYSDLGQLTEVSTPDFKMPDQDIRLGFLVHKKHHIIQAYFPTQIHTNSSRLRNHKNSWLYMEFNGAHLHWKLLQEIKFNVLTFTLGMFFTTILTWWILRMMVIKPLVEQGKASQKIGMGNQEVQVASAWFSELSLLGNSINQMAYNLQLANEKLVEDAIEQEQLIQQLEDKNAELERFTYTVSHDLKSPLVTVKGFVGLLKQDIKDNKIERVHSDLQQIASAADKMALLLDDLLELSRVGRVVNSPEKVNLSGLFHEVLLIIHGQIEASGAKIEIQADMPSIFADKQRMLEVIQNLLDNAIKFRQQRTASEISVTATIKRKKVVCCVADNGIGIDHKYHNKIFGLFNRLDTSVEGTGIGLALVKRIIEVHNGLITVESDGEGKGSKFYFSIQSYQEK